MNERNLSLAAIEIPDAEARAKYIEQQCVGNPRLQASVERYFCRCTRIRAVLWRNPSHNSPGLRCCFPRMKCVLPTLSTISVPVLAFPMTRHAHSRPRDPDGQAAGLLAPSTVAGSMGRTGPL